MKKRALTKIFNELPALIYTWDISPTDKIRYNPPYLQGEYRYLQGEYRDIKNYKDIHHQYALPKCKQVKP